MALQPATGARDLNPKQVQQNQHLREQLATVYRNWGYDEVSPPQVERLDTLMAGGAIASHDVVRLVADEPLGLRPEMTASIARAACTRLKDRPRPLRLCACGTIFESRTAEEGGLCIEEKLHSGVELFGVKDLAAELELLTLLLEVMNALSLLGEHQPQLLIGHTSLMELILAPFEQPMREEIRTCLIQYDRLGLEAMGLEAADFRRLVNLLDCRGTPKTILDQLAESFGSQPVLNDLKRLFLHLTPLADQQSLALQLDPTFHPHHELYDGLVFQLVCQGVSAPVVIARGGRYDGLIETMGGPNTPGVGWAAGIERLSMLCGAAPEARRPVALIPIGEEAVAQAPGLAEKLRVSGLRIDLGYSGNLGRRMKRANRLNARGAATLRDMDDGDQEEVLLRELTERLLKYL